MHVGTSCGIQAHTWPVGASVYDVGVPDVPAIAIDSAAPAAHPVSKELGPESHAYTSTDKPFKRRRIASLDWARGWMLIASVSVNSILVMPAWFGHAQWEGVHPLDLIFPVFVTLSGCGLAFALGRVVKPKPLVKRFVVLMLVGLIYNAIVEWNVDVFTWRITGVLQLYAVLVALISLMHLVTKTWKGWAVLTFLLAGAHSLILLIYGSACPSGVMTSTCNPSGPIDSLIVGSSHMYAGGAAGYDPEGAIVILGALVSAAAGATVGHLLQAASARAQLSGKGPETAVRPLMLATVYFLVLAMFFKYVMPIAFGADLPIMKKLWTAPFALVVAAGTTLLLLLGHLLLDRSNVAPWFKSLSYPWVSLGRNSLLVYFGSHVLTSLLNRSFGGTPSVSERFASIFPSIGMAQIVWTGVMLAFWMSLAVYLNNRKIYLRP